MERESWTIKETKQESLEEKIEKQNTKIIHVLWIIFVSMITAIVTTLAIMSTPL